MFFGGAQRHHRLARLLDGRQAFEDQRVRCTRGVLHTDVCQGRLVCDENGSRRCEITCGVREDDLIVSVAGRTTEGENYDTVVQWIQSSPRPMNITFCAPEQLLSLVAEDLIRGVGSRDSYSQLPVRLIVILAVLNLTLDI